MIYLDTSVALAQILSENRHPPDPFWTNAFVSSRLIQYEIWTRLNGVGSSKAHRQRALELLNLIGVLEMSPEILESIVDGGLPPVRTLDAIHLATMKWMLDERMAFELATYDVRLAIAARTLGINVMSFDS